MNELKDELEPLLLLVVKEKGICAFLVKAIKKIIINS